MPVNNMEFEGLLMRSKVPIPFVEANTYLPAKVFIDGYFPAGTIFQFLEPICSQKISAFGEQVNDYCHAASILYSSKLNGVEEEEDDYTVIFHVDLSSLFLLMEPIDAEGKSIKL